ncbi:hypothetical protein ABTM67_19895, partial [Acinetobacter baumannii]
MSGNSDSAPRRRAIAGSLRSSNLRFGNLRGGGLDFLTNPDALLLAGVAVIGGSLLASQALERRDAPRRLATYEPP